MDHRPAAGVRAGLREVPELLSRWEDDGPTEPAPPCVAVAVATDRGLLVPTFAEPDVPAAAEVDAELRAVVAQAQGGKVDPSHMAPANASLSNLGGLGVDRFQALLTPPQASVLALGAVGRRPVAVPGGLGTALVVEAGLTVDHRVADGPTRPACSPRSRPVWAARSERVRPPVQTGGRTWRVAP